MREYAIWVMDYVARVRLSQSRIDSSVRRKLDPESMYITAKSFGYVEDTQSWKGSHI
jgi:hypothetical protein